MICYYVCYMFRIRICHLDKCSAENHETKLLGDIIANC